MNLRDVQKLQESFDATLTYLFILSTQFVTLRTDVRHLTAFASAFAYETINGVVVFVVAVIRIVRLG